MNDEAQTANQTPPTNGDTPTHARKLRVFGRTDVGQVREHNEDNFIVVNLATKVRGIREENRTPTVEGDGMVLGVCDGMGGAAAGEVASQMAVDLIHEQLSTGGAMSSRDDLARRLVLAIEYAGARIFQEARADRSRRGMGTTATIAALRDSRLFVGQVGDSRAYLLRGGKLVQLTRDQSLVNQLIEAGQLTEEEAETFEHNNIILQALGTAETVQVDLTFCDVRRGDVLLMCSDGLSGMIRSDDILDVLTRTPEPIDACRELTDRANAAGGHDNITVVVARFEDGFDPVTAGDTFGYQKYALPEFEPEAKERGYDTKPEGEAAAERHPDDKNLRVSHTMLGVFNPLLGKDPMEITSRSQPSAPAPIPSGEDSTPSNGSLRGRERHTGEDFGATMPEAPRALGRAHPLSDPPVVLPTHGLSPALQRTLWVGAVLLVVLLCYLVLR